MSTAAIASKLVEAMKAVDAVQKRGKNTQQNYTYVKATDVANEVRKALNDAGVAFSYSVLSERTWESQTKSGSTQFFCSLMVSATFTDSASGESITTQCIGWGADSQEKAPYKAMTGALKYALRMNFLIPDESDPEDAPVHESVPQQVPQRAQPAPASHSAPQQPRGPVAKISEPQSKRFFAIAKGGNKSNDDIKRYLMDVCKCERSLDMPRDKYEAACKWAEAETGEPEDDGPPPGYFTQDGTEITNDDIPF